MYCIIQQIERKKPDTHGAWKEYEVTRTGMTSNGKTTWHYGFYPKCSAGCFERPHREAYRITLHHSYRENGKVRKRQYSLCTVSWYDFADGLFSLYDYADRAITRAAKAEGMDVDALYGLVNAKIEPLRRKIEREFHKTEEYKAEQARKKLLKEHEKRRGSPRWQCRASSLEASDV